MTTYDVHFRDRATITVEADHYQLDRDTSGRVLGYEFLAKNSAHSSESIMPVRVLYASASEVVAIEMATSKTASGNGEKPQRDVSADAVEAMLNEFGKFFKGDFRR